MLAKRIIPCLDVKDGRVVKGVNFLGLRDAGDPVECASRYDAEGADELTFLDITASVEKRGIILDVVRRTAEQAFMPLTVGGGVRTVDDADRDGWEIYTHGGRRPTGIDAVKWARRMEDFGAGEILLTSMDRDGTKAGYDVNLTRAVAEAVGVPVIASGGVGGPAHMFEGLTSGKADAVLAASIFHYGEYSIGEVKAYLDGRGVCVRL